MLAQKLDMLMKLTNTQNIALARTLAFDPSYISRIRTGERGLPKHQPFAEPAAAFFTRRLREPYQKKAIADAVCPGIPWPENDGEAQTLLAAWLTNSSGQIGDSVTQMLSSFSMLSQKRSGFPEMPLELSSFLPEKTQFFYGNGGKRAAVEAFLTSVCTMGEPLTLLLFSDEDMSWLNEDDAFAARWAMLLVRFISGGGRIRIIHTVSRNIDEMLHAVQKWLPLYVTGAIEPYHYYKLRDGVYHRTLFIAQGHSAVVSSSVGSHTQESLNVLVYDANAVAALEGEFFDYFSLCRPLMQIFSQQCDAQFRQSQSDFEAFSENLITMQPVPSLFTMPDSVAASMAKRDSGRWLERRSASKAAFEKLLAQGCSVTEIIRLPDPKNVHFCEPAVPMCDLLGQPALCYTPAEFALHIENIVCLLDANENYRVVISNTTPNGVVLYAKENAGAVIARSEPPTTMFCISDQSMTSAFWEYLCRICERDSSSKSKTVKRLTNYINRI